MLLDPRSVADKVLDIEQVKTFKYLGVQVNSNLRCTQVAYVCAIIHQRLHFLHRFRVFGVCKSILLIFYRAKIESLLRYGMTSWFGNLTVKSQAEISSLVRTADKIMGIIFLMLYCSFHVILTFWRLYYMFYCILCLCVLLCWCNLPYPQDKFLPGGD